MDKNIEYCINQLYNAGELTECNYHDLCNDLDDYREAYDRITNCKAKYLIGEKVYVENDYFDKSNKNHVTLMEIKSISYDVDKETILYNYLYKEDELYPTEEDLITFLKTKYYKEYDVALKKLLQESLDMINKYILICVKRNKF